jgi:hypothetical protein
MSLVLARVVKEQHINISRLRALKGQYYKICF